MRIDGESVEELCRTRGITWHSANEREELADQLAVKVAHLLQKEVDKEGAASLVVSGGSTPAPFFKRLALSDISWQKVQVTLADERWVPADHESSNERLVRQLLLVDKAAEAQFVPLYYADKPLKESVSFIDEQLALMHQPFTVVILGMGTDGHTASLFPDAPSDQLAHAMDLKNESLVAVMTPPSVDQQRLTLTRSALLNSDNRILHISGEDKKQVLRDAILHSTVSAESDSRTTHYAAGMKPIIGLLADHVHRASVFWSA
ncbi:MAG: 6-phosphogluconolactonase [Granulosicoccus sp.]|nr:6-phosphogluconolactonase [Granulosicoccus sp.]